MKQGSNLPALEAHGDWVRLRTLIFLRWTAVVGQLCAIFAARLVYDIAIDLPLCLLTIGAAVAGNLVAIFLFPETKRLTESETLAMLMFDVAQLALLLGLTGGLENPFALLIIVPVTIAATALQTRATIFLGVVTIVVVSLIAVTALPLQFDDGTLLQVPRLFLFGFWLAIVIGVIFLGVYTHRIATENHSMADALIATQLALAREQKLTDLGGVVAAAAHELGTPLATIKLVSAELADELDREDHREDALLIRAQADRCRDILQSMGRAGKDDLHLRSAPLLAVLREAAEPHTARGKDVHFEGVGQGGAPQRQPIIYRYPELIHALRNLVQNAVDFAQSTVWVDASWTNETLTVRISDDGPGYPAGLLGRIGDPFLASKRTDAARPGYDGMGLGLFIAKTLLERTGARLSFTNGSDPFLTASEAGLDRGAIVEVTWPLERLLAETSGGLGANMAFE
ncbi:sensor histidine kinase RegB [Albirhodobacter sp. R86504]|uniref:sensor histidine kinase RegB n=1 Tax=Albirhodobacter sp. R86504 TaxID=3093848 RepID=UPI00366E8832